MEKSLLVVFAIIFLTVSNSCKREDISRDDGSSINRTLKGGSLAINEAESSTPITTSGQHTATMSALVGASGGYAESLYSTTTGEWIQFTVNVATAGVYNIQVVSASYNDRGIIGLSVNGTALGSNINQYAPALTYVTQDMGNATLVAGNNTFKFTVNSKDAASSGWKISVDYLNLTPRNEAELSTPITTSGQHTATMAALVGASGGYAESLYSTATGEWIQFTVNVAVAGTYNIDVISANYNDRGICTLYLDGTALGSNIDQYATALTYVSTDQGNVTLSAGNHTFKYTVVSKNASSSGWKMSVDYITMTPTSSAVAPTLGATTAATYITSTSATSGGNVTSDGGASVTARGVCWGTTSNPVVGPSNKTTNGTGTGEFTSTIPLNTLAANTTYYVRAYATNSAGTSYGAQMSFKTSVDVLASPYNATANDGTDDTDELQSAINDCPAGGTVYIPAGTFMIEAVTKHLDLKTNMILNMAGTLKAIPTSSDSYGVLQLQGVSDVTITGGTVQGDFNHGHIGTAGSGHGHGINILGSDHVTITGTLFKNCWGDGLYVGANGSIQTEVLRLTTVEADSNKRQGMSIIHADDVVVDNCTFHHTGGFLPEAGIDIEPNQNNTVNNVTIQNCTMSYNGRTGITLYKNHAAGFENSHVTNITITGCTIDNNVSTQGSMAGILVDGPTDYTITDNFVRNNGHHGVDLYVTNGSTVTGNTITGNAAYGVVLAAGSSNCNVTYNTIQNNTSGAIINSGTGNTTSPNTY